MAPTHFSRMLNILALVCLGLISKVEAQGTHMGVEFQVQFPYMPEGQPILMMYSTKLDSFDVYVTAPLSDHPVFETVALSRLQVTSYVDQRKYLTSSSSPTTSIVAKGKFNFGMTVFMPVSFHSAASFLVIPTSGWGVEYFILIPKIGPLIELIFEKNKISVRYTEPMEQLESQFTEKRLSTLAINRKQAYITQNCSGRTVGEQPLGVTPAKLTALYSFGVIVGSCEEYEFESECQRKNVKTAGGVTADFISSEVVALFNLLLLLKKAQNTRNPFIKSLAAILLFNMCFGKVKATNDTSEPRVMLDDEKIGGWTYTLLGSIVLSVTIICYVAFQCVLKLQNGSGKTLVSCGCCHKEASPGEKQRQNEASPGVNHRQNEASPGEKQRQNEASPGEKERQNEASPGKNQRQSEASQGGHHHRDHAHTFFSTTETVEYITVEMVNGTPLTSRMQTKQKQAKSKQNSKTKTNLEESCEAASI